MEDEGLIPEFLSTPSVGRATRTARTHRQMSADFYPRPPWGGRPCYADDFVLFGKFLSTPSVGRGDVYLVLRFEAADISIHALRGEGDVLRRRFCVVRQISIHALRGEGDRRSKRWGRFSMYFYPRPPWGGRRKTERRTTDEDNFYPRPPWGGRQGLKAEQAAAAKFLSTPSVGRATPAPPGISCRSESFLSTPSVGRATVGQPQAQALDVISIHALRGEGDPGGMPAKTTRSDFYPRPPWGGRLARVR